MTEQDPNWRPIDELIGDRIFPPLRDQARRALEALRTNRWPVLLGPTGSGKTHILGWLLQPDDPKRGARGIDRWEAYLSDIRSSFGRHDMAPESVIRQRLADKGGLLVLDDVGAAGEREKSDWAVAVLGFVIHKREAWNRPVALTSNLSLEALAEAIGDRSYSRLRSKAVVIEMPPVDFRMLEQD